jgi:hypothetical protein
MFYDRWADRRPDPEVARRMGVLTATGLIVGESLWGVAYALIVYVTKMDAPLNLPLGDSFAPFALVGGTILFVAAIWFLYRRAMRLCA